MLDLLLKGVIDDLEQGNVDEVDRGGTPRNRDRGDKHGTGGLEVFACPAEPVLILGTDIIPGGILGERPVQNREVILVGCIQQVGSQTPKTIRVLGVDNGEQHIALLS